MTRVMSEPLAYVVGAIFLLALVIFLLSLQQLRRGRKGPYWRMRKQAGQRGGQLFLVAVSLFSIGMVIAVLGGLYEMVMDEIYPPTPTEVVILPTATPTFTASPITPTANIDETVAAAIAGTSTAMYTAPPPTFTDSPTVDMAEPPPSPNSETDSVETQAPVTAPAQAVEPTQALAVRSIFTPYANSVPPRAVAQLHIATISTTMPEGSSPADESDITLGAWGTRLYVPLTFSGMNNNVSWSRALYRDGQAIQGGSYLWANGETGEMVFFFGQEAGYPPGAYEIRLYLGETQVAQRAFTLE